MHAKDSDIAKYKGRYDAGYTPVRAARLQKLKQLNLLDERWRITPQAGDWEKVENKEWEARCMEVYAAMVDCMDQGIGRLVDTLKKNGQYQSTVILFLQDNGGCAEGMGRGGPFKARPAQPTLEALPKEYLQPDMIPKQTRNGFPVRQGAGVIPGGADTYIGYGRDWANVSNTPFREYKHLEHEGGISTPLIAHWPAGMQGGGSRSALMGGLVSAPAHLIDVMVTCVDLGGANYPMQHRGKPVIPMEGVSLVPALNGWKFERENPLFWEHEGNRAVRVGEWKLVSRHAGSWELYDMSSDRTEMNDLALQHPERVREMELQWNEWAARVGVVPWPLGAGTPKRNAVKTDGQ
jgi:arylsulfatase